MVRTKKMPGSQQLPAPVRDILAGIATELMDLDPLLRVLFFRTPSFPIQAVPVWKDGGVYLKRRKLEFLKVVLSGDRITASYRWNGRIIPAKPVPDKPGYIYPARLSDAAGSWSADIQDPESFRKWLDNCQRYVRERVDYLEQRRAKIVNRRRLAEDNARLAHESNERWKARWAAIEANMYCI